MRLRAKAMAARKSKHLKSPKVRNCHLLLDSKKRKRDEVDDDYSINDSENNESSNDKKGGRRDRKKVRQTSSFKVENKNDTMSKLSSN
jgi:hypothetical protein